MRGPAAIDAQDLAEISDRHVLRHVQAQDAPEHAQAKKPELSAMHATRPSMVATVIWRMGRSMLAIMDEPGTSGKRRPHDENATLPRPSSILRDSRGSELACARIFARRGSGTTDQCLLAKARITV